MPSRGSSRPPARNRYQAPTIADIPPAAFVEQQVNGWLTPWEVARRGFQLLLATPNTYAERVAGVREELQQTRGDGFRQEYRRLHGAGVACAGGGANVTWRTQHFPSFGIAGEK